LADEQLTGPARDKVAARAERFVSFQVETLLKPLVDLKTAEQLSGIARGIAFQLVEQFGLINRRDIAEEMRSLDQEGRAALRRLGVRFGAYHVFVPALIKPAPAGLVTLLWALKNDGKDKPGFGDVVNALATGRTSVVVDAAFDKTFYRLAGYRNLGRRAVRVDILERLADLIRPATNWKPGLGPRPDGAYDGTSFMVTPPMMSILGATADDMEEILKGLGYRAEPKPAAEVKARVEAEDEATRRDAEARAAEKAAAEAQAAADAAPAETGEAASAQADGNQPETETAVVDAVTSVETASDEITPVQDETPEIDAHAADVSTIPADAGQSAPEAEAETAVQAVLESPAAEEASADPAVGEAAAEEPKPVLLWRQARFERHRGGQRQDQRQRGGQARHQAATGAEAGTQGEGDGGKGRGERRRFDRDRFKSGKPQGEGRQERPEGKSQGERQDRRQGRPEGRPDWKAGKGGGKPQFQAKPREERPARFDPDSPFAKLAALRDQLKK
jgi:ATP-dependent RNA helicase SUPV3L1/SUV3